GVWARVGEREVSAWKRPILRSGEAEERLVAGGKHERWAYKARQGGKKYNVLGAQSYRFALNQWIHVSSLLFPRWRCFSGIAGPEEAKNAAGKCPPPVSDPFNGAKSGENHDS